MVFQIHPQYRRERISFSRTLRFVCFALSVPLFIQVFPASCLARTPNEFYQKGTALLKQNSSEQAVNEFRSVLELDPDHRGGRYNLGCALVISGQYEQGVREWEGLLPLEDEKYKWFILFNLGSAHYRMAVLNQSEADLAKAKEYLGVVVAQTPEWLLLPRDMMNFAHMFGLYPSKLTINVIGFPPDTAIFCDTLGNGEGEMYVFDETTPPPLYFYRSPTVQFITAYEMTTFSDRETMTAVAQNLEEAPAKFDKALLFNALSSLGTNAATESDAIEYFTKAVDLELEYPIGYTNLAATYYKLGKIEKSQNFVDRALVVDPKHEVTLRLKGLQEKVAFWKSETKKKPNDYTVWGNLGNAYADFGQFDDAIRYFKKAGEINPNSPEVYINLGGGYLALGQYEEAIRHYQKATLINPALHEIENLIGYSYIELGQPEEAIRHYRRAVEINSNYPTAYINLGYAYARLGKLDQAREQMLKAKSIFEQEGNKEGLQLINSILEQ